MRFGRHFNPTAFAIVDGAVFIVGDIVDNVFELGPIPIGASNIGYAFNAPAEEAPWTIDYVNVTCHP